MINELLVLALVRFTGLDGQWIDVNPETIISVRVPRSTDHFGPGTKCLLFTVDGRNIPVQEDCGIARLRLGGKQ